MNPLSLPIDLGAICLRDSLDHSLILTKILELQLTQEELQRLVGSCSSYLTRYNSECRQCSQNDIGRLMQSDAANTCKIIRMNPTYDFCLQQVSQSISSRPAFATNARLLEVTTQAMIAFCVRVVFLIDGESWSGSQTFQDYLTTRKLKQSGIVEKGVLFEDFHVMNLLRIGGIQVHWTDLLSEHLSLQLEGKALYVFKHIDLLEHLVKQTVSNVEFAAETKRTYAILFPHFNDDINRWFVEEREKHGLSGSIPLIMNIPAEDRLLLSFSYWRDRLIVLKEEFDNHEPVGLQYFYDSRSPARQWAFLAAVLVFFFGMAQVVLGSLQVYKAYHPSSPS